MTLAVTDRFSSSRSFRRLLPPDDGWVRAGGHEQGQHHDRPSSPSRHLFARGAKAGIRARRKPMPRYAFMCERCKKAFEVVLTVAARAAAKVACPTCGSREVIPQMAVFTARTSRKS
jgi:putative FmdB family regulatory protein